MSFLSHGRSRGFELCGFGLRLGFLTQSVGDAIAGVGTVPEGKQGAPELRCDGLSGYAEIIAFRFDWAVAGFVRKRHEFMLCSLRGLSQQEISENSN